MKLHHLLITLCFVLAACTTPPTPFLDVTTTPTPAAQTEFTARLNVGASAVIRRDTIYLGSISIRYVVDEQGNVTQPTDYTSPICYMAPGGTCVTQGANELLVNGVTLSIESGHWCATPAEGGYTSPVEC